MPPNVFGKNLVGIDPAAAFSVEDVPQVTVDVAPVCMCPVIELPTRDNANATVNDVGVHPPVQLNVTIAV